MTAYSPLSKIESPNRKYTRRWCSLKILTVPLLIALFGTAIILILNWFNQSEPTPVIQTGDGAVQGTVGYSRDNKKFWQFLGIKYGIAPIGARKFRPPVPMTPWGNNVRQVVNYPPNCAQVDYVLTGSVNGEMDCLYLNVFVNVAHGLERKKPVLVFIHGGGFTSGGSNIYHPEYFMDQDVVLVVMNYRLGPLGFLNLEKSQGLDVARGNMGLKDQNLALQWIQKNIANFFGDPKSVTVIGQSAGAALTHIHVLSPMSRGLFHKAIIHSGTANMPWAVDSNPAAFAAEHAKSFNCLASNADKLFECYNNTEWVEAAKHLNPMMEPLLPTYMFKPTLDGKFLKEYPIDTLKSGNFPKIPVMFAVNSGEGGVRTARFDAQPETISKLDSEWVEHIKDVLVREPPVQRSTAEKIRKEYFQGEKFTTDVEGFKMNLTKLFGDAVFFEPAHSAAIYHANGGAPTYMLYYNYTSNIFPGSYTSFKACDSKGWVPKIVKQVWFVVLDWILEYILGGKGSRPYGIGHGEDMYQLWNLEGLSIWLAGWDADFSRAFVKALVDFANDTNPLTFRDVVWPTINTHLVVHKDEYAMPYMLMDNEDNPRIIPEPFGNRLKFWTQLEGWH